MTMDELWNITISNLKNLANLGRYLGLGKQLVSIEIGHVPRSFDQILLLYHHCLQTTSTSMTRTTRCHCRRCSTAARGLFCIGFVRPLVDLKTRLGMNAGALLEQPLSLSLFRFSQHDV